MLEKINKKHELEVKNVYSYIMMDVAFRVINDESIL